MSETRNPSSHYPSALPQDELAAAKAAEKAARESAAAAEVLARTEREEALRRAQMKAAEQVQAFIGRARLQSSRAQLHSCLSLLHS